MAGCGNRRTRLSSSSWLCCHQAKAGLVQVTENWAQQAWPRGWETVRHRGTCYPALLCFHRHTHSPVFEQESTHQQRWEKKLFPSSPSQTRLAKRGTGALRVRLSPLPPALPISLLSAPCSEIYHQHTEHPFPVPSPPCQPASAASALRPGGNGQAARPGCSTATPLLNSACATRYSVRNPARPSEIQHPHPY